MEGAQVIMCPGNVNTFPINEVEKMRKRRALSDTKFAYLLLAPSLILLAALIGYPMLYNIYISVLDVPVNPRKPSVFVVVVLSTVVGLAMACFLNRKFVGKKLVNSLIILSYVIPSVCLIFAWRYMFNNIYGIINYIVVDVLHLAKEVPLWFDQPVSAFILAALFCIWRFFPYAYLSFTAILQTIDKSLYEAADIDGATAWQKFKVVTYPALKSTMVTVVSLRIIWVFYIYAEVYLLTKQVDVIGVYLYDMAFATHDFGKAAAISLLLFVLIFACVIMVRKVVLRSEKEE